MSDLADVVKERRDEQLAIRFTLRPQRLADAAQVRLIETRQPAEDGDLLVGQQLGQEAIAPMRRSWTKRGDPLAQPRAHRQATSDPGGAA